jgi:hypothetical protein
LRVDPETVYLELAPGSMTFNFTTNDFTKREAVILHWKPKPEPGTKWARRTFVGESLGAILHQVGTYLDEHGLDGLAPLEPEPEVSE